MRISKRLLALNLALLFVVVLLPLQALAAELVPGTAYSYEKTAESAHEKMTFCAAEDGFYRLTVSSKEHPDYSVVSIEASSAPMNLYWENVNWRSYEDSVSDLFFAEAGKTTSFQLQKSRIYEQYEGKYDDTGKWTYQIEKVETPALTLGMVHKLDSRICTFTPEKDGAYWIGFESNGYWGSVFCLPKMDQIGSFDSREGFTARLQANVTYALVLSSYYNENATILVKEAARSGAFGDNGGLTWEVTEDGVLKIGGSDTCEDLGTAPWRLFKEDIHTVEIGKDAHVGAVFGQLPNLAAIQLESGNRHLTLRDGALYSSDLSTLYLVPGTVTKFSVPENTGSIGNYAFSACSEMSELTIPASVESISNMALYYATGLKDIYYLGKVSAWRGLTNQFSIPYYTHYTVHFVNAEHDDQFYYERNDTDNSYTLVGAVKRHLEDAVTIPAQFNGKPVTQIGSSAFMDFECSIVIIPEGIVSIGDEAFKFNSIVKLGLPVSLQHIGQFAFDVYELKDVYYAGTEDQWTALTDEMGEGNDPLLRATKHYGEPCPTQLDAEDYLYFSVTDTEAAVTGQKRLLPVDAFAIPAYYQGVPVTKICAYAINMGHEEAHTVLTIPETVKTIEPGSLFFISAFEVDADNPYFMSEDGAIYSKDGKTLVVYPPLKEGTLTIPEHVTSVAPGASYAKVPELIIPDQVTEFGTEDFPSFFGLWDAKHIHLGAGVTDLTKVLRMEMLESLDSITASEKNPAYTVKNGDLYSRDGKTLALHPAQLGDELVTPANVPVLGKCAYANTVANSVRIGSDVTTLAYGVFFGAKNLKSLSIPDNVKSLDEGLLHTCSSVEQVALPEGLEEIPNGTLYGTTELQSLYVPASVKTFGQNSLLALWSESFREQLTIYFGGTEEQWNSITTQRSRWDPETETILTEAVPVSEKLVGTTVICNHVHDLDAGVPDPDHPGQLIRTCSECGKIVYEQVEEHTHQTELKNAKDASCTDAGYTGDKVCTICGVTVEKGKTIPAKGHGWSEWSVTKEPTETAEGVESRMCAACGKTETHSIPKLDPQPADPTKPDDTKPVDPSPKPSDPIPPVEFKDVSDDAYYAAPVAWAVDKQITDGTSETTFSPEDTCTRGQIVTFLWRAAEKPEPKSTNNPFADVQESDYFYKAVLWAVEQGITDGMTETTFGPNEGCTRGQVVTFLHRANELPAVKNASNPFADVTHNEYYYDAVLWAVEQGITDGTSETTFSPNDTCTRGQIVTFLYRDMAE